MTGKIGHFFWGGQGVGERWGTEDMPNLRGLSAGNGFESGLGRTPWSSFIERKK